jgi:hypothetical protein
MVGKGALFAPCQPSLSRTFAGGHAIGAPSRTAGFAHPTIFRGDDERG